MQESTWAEGRKGVESTCLSLHYHKPPAAKINVNQFADSKEEKQTFFFYSIVVYIGSTLPRIYNWLVFLGHSYTASQMAV